MSSHGVSLPFRLLAKSMNAPLRSKVRDVARDVQDRILFGLDRIRRPNENLRIAVLFVYADVKAYEHSAEALTEVFRMHPPYISPVVRIDNFNPDKEVTQIDEQTWDIPGDNTWREFSGFEKGIRFVETFENLPDVVVCVNDAFLNYARWGADVRYFRRLFNPIVLREAQSALIGVHCVPDTPAKDHRLLGYDVSEWIRTNFFALPYSTAVDHLGPAVTEKEADELFDREWSGRMFKPNNLCSKDFEEFQIEWMTRRWRWATTPDADNWQAMRMKLIAILNERMLTATIRAAGVPMRYPERMRWWTVPRLVES